MDHDDASTHPINNSTKHNAKSRWSNNNQQPLLFVARLAVVQSLSGKIRAKKVMKPFVFRAVFLLRHCCMYFDRLTCRKQRLMRCDYDSHKNNIHWSEQKSVLKFIKRIWEDRFSLVSFFLFTDWSIGTESAAKTVFFSFGVGYLTFLIDRFLIEFCVRVNVCMPRYFTTQGNSLFNHMFDCLRWWVNWCIFFICDCCRFFFI